MTLRHFLRDDDISSEEQSQILHIASVLKKDPYKYRPFDGPQSVAVLFDKDSTRTRFSFSAGISALGGYPIVADSGSTQLGKRESISDTARVLSGYVSAIIWRTYSHADIEELSRCARVPVINGLTDLFHPCQVLADLLTIKEHKGPLAELSLAYVGDGANNMAHSLLLGGALAGIDVTISSPASLQPNSDIVANAQKIGHSTGASIRITQNSTDAVTGVDVVITDTWVSMNTPKEIANKQRKLLNPYQVNEQLLSYADPQAIVLHCLPAHRGEEITDDIMDGPHSVIFDEAENRIHTQKALLLWLHYHITGQSLEPLLSLGVI